MQRVPRKMRIDKKVARRVAVIRSLLSPDDESLIRLGTLRLRLTYKGPAKVGVLVLVASLTDPPRELVRFSGLSDELAVRLHVALDRELGCGFLRTHEMEPL